MLINVNQRLFATLYFVMVMIWFAATNIWDLVFLHAKTNERDFKKCIIMRKYHKEILMNHEEIS